MKLRDVPLENRRVNGYCPTKLYVLCDKEGEVRYVGFTSMSLEGRLSDQLAQPGNKDLRAWFSIEKPTIHLLTYTTVSNWAFDKQKWVTYFTDRGTLYNKEIGDKQQFAKKLVRKQKKFTGKLSYQSRYTKHLSGPVKVFTPEEIARLQASSTIP